MKLFLVLTLLISSICLSTCDSDADFESPDSFEPDSESIEASAAAQDVQRVNFYDKKNFKFEKKEANNFNLYFLKEKYVKPIPVGDYVFLETFDSDPIGSKYDFSWNFSLFFGKL